MTRYNTQTLLPSLLDTVPEIRKDYEAMQAECIEGRSRWIEQYFEDMRRIEKLHDLPPLDPSQPGITIVMENLVVPFIRVVALEHKDTDRSSGSWLWSTRTQTG